MQHGILTQICKNVRKVAIVKWIFFQKNILRSKNPQGHGTKMEVETNKHILVYHSDNYLLT